MKEQLGIASCSRLSALHETIGWLSSVSYSLLNLDEFRTPLHCGRLLADEAVSILLQTCCPSAALTNLHPSSIGSAVDSNLEFAKNLIQVINHFKQLRYTHIYTTQHWIWVGYLHLFY